MNECSNNTALSILCKVPTFSPVHAVPNLKHIFLLLVMITYCYCDSVAKTPPRRFT